MVTGCVEARPSGDSAESPSVPPGFSPLLSFKLEKVQDIDAKPCVGFSPPAVPEAGRNVDACSKGPEDKLRKSLRQRPTINYNEVDGSSEEDSDSEMLDHVISSINTLKKGVIRGCSTCENCQRVLARWQPSNSRRPILEEAPVFYPTEEEFQDTMKYIGSIRERAESYGICRIVPPPSWKPPCPLNEENIWKNSKFATRVQRIHRLQNRPTHRQSSRYQSMSRKKRRRLLKQGIGHRDIDEYSVETSYPTYCADNLEFGPGPHFTLESFSKYADDFSVQYFRSEAGSQDERKIWSPPSVEEIEGEYWRIVEKPTEEIEVLYGADLETGEFCSGFPKALDKNDANTKYVSSGWNLNNLPRLPGSVLSFESADISGVLVPWLYVGMCFSSFCWHVEDHHLYSLNYMHWGAPKMWYGVPGGDAVKLEEAMKKHLPELFEEQHDLLHKLVTQFSPSILISEGVPVYRCVQNAGEFVLTFPRGYHSGFNCGFNCAEAVNVAPFDWLPHGQIAVELYHHQCRKITISHDKLLIGAARQAVRAQWELSFLKKTTSDSLLWKNVCGPDKVLSKALKARLEVERHRRAQFCTASQCRKMDTNFDSSGDKECFICHFDLYLSATGCVCSPDKYACLCHTEQLCSCERSMRVFLFRYEIGEINILVDALGGKLSAIHKWGNTDLGLSLTSVVAQRKAQERSSVNQSSMGGKVLVKPDNGGCYGASQHSKEFCIYNEKQNQYRGGATLCNPDVSSCEKGQEVFIHDVKVDPLSCMPRVSSSEKVPVDPGLVKKVPEELNKIGNTLNHESSMLQNSAFESNLKENFALESSLCDGNSLSAEPSFKHCDNNMKSETQGDSFLSISDSRSCMVKFPETFIQIRTSDNRATTCNHQDKILSIPETSASVMEENGPCLLHNVEDMGLQSSHSNTQEKAKGEMLADSMPFVVDRQTAQKNILNVFVGTSNAKAVQNPVVSNQIDIVNGSINRCKAENSAPLKIATEDAKVLFDSVIRTIDGQSITDNSPCSSNSVEGASLQRGPRMAKVVRRFNCSVEPLQLGMVLSGKLWSTSQVIYPKGYRSRVRYFSIRDPAQMCYYVSEILDGGPYGPLFMVQVEHYPSDVFIHLSPTKCWDMVRERINSEIKWQHAHGKPNVPCLQPPGSVDGLGMFGLSSPSVIQAIESLDQYQLCSEYWKSRNPGRTMTDLDSAPYPNLGSGAGILRNLFKKADSEELSLLNLVLSDDRSSFRREVIDLLHEHRQKLPESTDCT